MFKNLDEQLRELLSRSESAAEKAAACIMSFYGKDLEIWDKGIGSHTGDCVTEADHAAQDVIFETLFKHGLDSDPILHNVAVLAEEMPDYSASKRFEKDLVFLIDPLDGTRGFLDHTNSFATSIALIRKDGTPVFGVVNLPAFRRSYVGVHGRGLEENGKRISIPPLGKELVLLVSEAEIFAPDKNAVWHHVCDELKRQLGITTVRPQVIGSPVHKGAYTVACGVPTLYLGLPRAKKGVSIWDLAAIASLVDGAGGAVSDVYGQPLELNRADSTYVHHHGFIFASHKEIGQVTIAALAQLDNIVF